jgi:hypothetical protein
MQRIILNILPTDLPDAYCKQIPGEIEKKFELQLYTQGKSPLYQAGLLSPYCAALYFVSFTVFD